MKRFPLTSDLKTFSLWEKIGLHHHHGIALPLFSLHKENSGIGEILDLIPIIDWLHDIGMDILQLLPLNDMNGDFSPYNANSSFAIDPSFISLSEFSSQIPLYPFTKKVDWKLIKEEKVKWLHNYFSTKKPKVSLTDPYFIDYATKKDPQNINFHLFLQQTALSQLKKVKEYATAKKVFILGDLPLFVSPESIDVKNYKNLFLSSRVGAPPDEYNEEGQNWNFFAFNWDEMRKNHFHWWRQRIVTLTSYSHLYRIDHAVGLFRLYVDQSHFIPKTSKEWELLGKELLTTFLSFSDSLPIAEDLGTIPKVTYKVLNELGIPGTKVMRWEKELFKDYSPCSLTTLSTHDCEPLSLFYGHLTLSKRLQMLHDSHHSGSLFHVNLLQEYLALFPELSWEDPNEDRINVPGTISKDNWSFRFKPTIDELINHTNLKKSLTSLIQDIR